MVRFLCHPHSRSCGLKCGKHKEYHIFGGKSAGFWNVHCLHFLHGVMIFQVLLVKKLHTIKTSVACVYACVASMSCKMQFCDI